MNVEIGVMLGGLVAALGLATEVSAAALVTSIPINRTWDVLTPPEDEADFESYRPVLRQAGELLATWRIHAGGRGFDGSRLTEIADKSPEEPFLRLVREELRRPFDLLDLLLFLDDVLLAGDRGLRGRPVWVPGGRARNAGITIHPDDVFKKGRPRLYAALDSEVAIDKPKRPAKLRPARNGDLLGPRWSARFRNPPTSKRMLAALDEKNTSGTFSSRIRGLRQQVRAQGGDFYIYATVRSRERGYLMWGAFMLSRQENEAGVRAGVAKLKRVNAQWGLRIQIDWAYPRDWEATREAAREMSDAYDVVYATEGGARNSRHYGGTAIDFGVLALPRQLTLEAPDGVARTFDLSDPEHPRDLNLSPELIDWVEAHFQMEKLRSDYPHWTDTAPPR